MDKKACKFCRESIGDVIIDTPVNNNNDLISVGIEHGDLAISSFETGVLKESHIKYCPMCGRKLWRSLLAEEAVTIVRDELKLLEDKR